MTDLTHNDRQVGKDTEQVRLVPVKGREIIATYIMNGFDVKVLDAKARVPDNNRTTGTTSPEVGSEGLRGQQQANREVTVDLAPDEMRILEKKLVQYERDDVYAKKIVPDYFENKVGVEKPKLIILVGQSGAGKSELTRKSTGEQAKEGRSIIIDPDDLRKFNPHYLDDIRVDSRTAADRAEVRDWTNTLYLDALIGRHNIVYDGTGGNQESYLKRLYQARSQGYNIDFRIVAARGDDSWINVLKRHEEGILRDRAHPELDPTARMVPKPPHDRNAGGLIETVGRVEYLGLADSITVFQSGNYDKPIYQNLNARQGRSTGAVDALLAERDRPRTGTEFSNRADYLKKTEALMVARGASPTEIAELRQLEFVPEDPGFRQGFGNAAHQVLGRPVPSPSLYAASPLDQQTVRMQALHLIGRYQDSLISRGIPQDRIDRIVGALAVKLDDPAQAYGIRAGLELREMRDGLKTTDSIKTVRDYFLRREQAASQILQVKSALGREVTPRYPMKAKQVSERASWEQLGFERRASLNKGVREGTIKPEAVPAEVARQGKIIESMRAQSLARTQGVKREISVERGGGGGGRDRTPFQAMFVRGSSYVI